MLVARCQSLLLATAPRACYSRSALFMDSRAPLSYALKHCFASQIRMGKLQTELTVLLKSSAVKWR